MRCLFETHFGQIVENMLSKVMEEFEHRLASQNEQVGTLSLLAILFFYKLYNALLLCLYASEI